MKSFPSKIYSHLSILVAAIIVGLLAVLYAKVIAFAQAYYFQLFSSHSQLLSILSPLIFVLATFLVRRFAPEAKGSGIPQVLQAIEIATKAPHSPEIWQTPLVSVKTAVVKVFSSIVGILGGASIGREGPTVQIAASAFAWVGRRMQRWVPHINFEAYLIAGAASGIAAAFNTPLAGIVFALEEITDSAFGPFRQTALLAVIISGITAQMWLGDYLYFGHPILTKSNVSAIPEAALIGIVCGLFGGGFAKLLVTPKLLPLPGNWLPRALVSGTICSVIGYMTQADTAGSGYEVTQKVLAAASIEEISWFSPFFKLTTTIFSYLSGMAGGIFSPSLSTGAGIGASVAKIAGFVNFQTCALIGMVAFFSGVIQAPLTAVIIVMEMTDEHVLILPFMVAAFVAHTLAKWIVPIPIYSLLAGRAQKECAKWILLQRW